MRRTTVAVGLCLLSTFVATTAAAQTRVQNTRFRENKVVDDTLLKSGRFEVGLQSSGMWSSDSGESDDGTVTASASNLYMNPAATAGYMVLDNLQARLALGWLSVSTTNNDVSVQNFGGFLGSLQAVYHVPMRLGTAMYVGAGGGWFTGSTDRPGPQPNSEISNSTSGFAGHGVLGLLLQPGPMFLLRGGLRFDALVGSESSSDAAMPDISSTNLKLMGEFGIGLRF